MEVLKYLWQLPQLIVAFIFYCYLSYIDDILDICTYQEAIVIIRKSPCISVTIGQHIFLSSRTTDTEIKHTWGHTKQSMILGPLYLIIISIPSIIWAAIHKRVAPHKSYYWLYTEAWANKLGGVE